MKRGLWMLTVFLLSAVLVLPLNGVEGKKAADPPDPQPAGTVPKPGEAGIQGYTPGTWYVGATPPNVDYSKPPIVFVQGLHGKAQDWWEDTAYYGHNDMYDYAYYNGYRTAFVQLHDAAGGDAADMWDNGELLAGLLGDIHQYFGEPVNIVAHSKGGIDTQAALIHSGAWSHVGRVITLASPHRGSHLADLAYSWWAGWLAELLGARDAGTESLQTGYMDYYRSVTDPHANVGKNSYYTAAGTSWGPFPSALWTGGAYLSVYGDNDGLVNVWSTPLPYGQHLFTANLDHDNIRMGSTSFPRIEPFLRSTAKTAGMAEMNREVAAASSAAASSGSEQVVRGGPLAAGQTVTETIPVESGNDEVVFNLMTESSGVNVELISPGGTQYTSRSPEYLSGTDTEIFQNARVQAFKIPQPEAGEWKVRMTSPGKDAYLLTATFMGTRTLTAEVDAPHGTDQKVPVRVKLTQPGRWQPDRFDVEVKVTPSQARTMQAMRVEGFQGKLKAKPGQSGIFSGEIPAVSAPGTYNVTIDIQGVSRDGEPFRRTIIRSFHVPGHDRSVR